MVTRLTAPSGDEGFAVDPSVGLERRSRRSRLLPAQNVYDPLPAERTISLRRAGFGVATGRAVE